MAVAPTLPPTPVRPRPTRIRRPWPLRLIFFLVGFYGLAAIDGLTQALPPGPSLTNVFVPFAFAVILSGWAMADARARRRPFPMLSCSWVFWYAFPIVPGYLLQSRRWHGLAWLAVHAIGWVAVSALVRALVLILAAGS